MTTVGSVPALDEGLRAATIGKSVKVEGESRSIGQKSKEAQMLVDFYDGDFANAGFLIH
jgi:hypothetical protein